MRLHGWSLQYQILGISSLVLSLLASSVLYVKRRSHKTLHPVAVSRASRPSEMSIFQISSSHSKKYPKLEDDEAQSIEKIPAKHASGGEEVITHDLEEKVDYMSQLSDVDKAKVDYTSQLLDDVLSSILSRMTIKDAVKTRILSTRWRYLVASMLTLQFSLDMFDVNYLGPTCQPYYQKNS
ncbi:hypothetical protein CQW23_04752 [Capsicum baccatum]|uniref:F-box domain-containing protein n=1 Tax=Capsicum baccatum TaxID=33114 RepID=A0A2G2XFI9_CAPBA|nr:hypothetical protein CQW23_04752 [Capsicum baccatum]